MYWRGVSGAAVPIGVQVVERAVELIVGGLQQGWGAAAQRTWGAAAQQAGWTPAGQSRRVSSEEAVAAASHQGSGTAVHEPRGPQQRQGSLRQSGLQER